MQQPVWRLFGLYGRNCQPPVSSSSWPDLDSHLNLVEDPYLGLPLEQDRQSPKFAAGLGISCKAMDSGRLAGLLFGKFTQITTSLRRLVASDLIGLGRFARPSPLPMGSDLSSIHLSSTYRFSRSGPFWALRRFVIIARFLKTCIKDCSAQGDGPPVRLDVSSTLWSLSRLNFSPQ